MSLGTKVRRTEPFYDSKTDALIQVDVDEHLLHKGLAYAISYIIPHGSELANDATLIFGMETGDREVHFSWNADVGGDSHIETYEGGTLTGGSPLAVHNRNRNGDVASVLLTVIGGPTVSVAGAVMSQYYIPAGSGPQSRGGSKSGNWILSPNETYYMVLTNRSGAVMLGGVHAEFSEQVNGA